MKTIAIEQVYKSQLPPMVGMPFGGGFYYGTTHISGLIYALVVAPIITCELNKATWGENGRRTDAISTVDGLANTLKMSAHGQNIAVHVRSLQINGKSDWYIPARDELELLYRCLNIESGGLHHSLPEGSITKWQVNSMGTSVSNFDRSALQKHATPWLWSSTEVSDNEAMGQLDARGIRYYSKESEMLIPVIRRLVIV